MEYFPSGSLADYLQEGKQFNESQLRAITSCCLKSLFYTHHRKDMHLVGECTLDDCVGHQAEQHAHFPRSDQVGRN